MATLNVRNLAQATLFELELKGQLSDGYWENARPGDHWEVWCRCEVAVDPAAVGRDFYARRSSYNFAAPDLLEVVGRRMLGYVRIALVFGLEKAKELECLFDLEGELQTMERIEKNVELYENPGAGRSYWRRLLELAKSVDMERLARVVEDETLYDGRLLRQDLRDLGRIVKMHR